MVSVLAQHSPAYKTWVLHTELHRAPRQALSTQLSCQDVSPLGTGSGGTPELFASTDRAQSPLIRGEQGHYLPSLPSEQLQAGLGSYLRALCSREGTQPQLGHAEPKAPARTRHAECTAGFSCLTPSDPPVQPGEGAVTAHPTAPAGKGAFPFPFPPCRTAQPAAFPGYSSPGLFSITPGAAAAAELSQLALLGSHSSQLALLGFHSSQSLC